MGRGRHSPEDLGEQTDDGAWTLLGRVGRTIKIGGRKLDLAEVELALKSLPGVMDAVALPDPARSEGVAAAVVSGESSASIRTALASRLATWKLPDRILVLTEFPATSRGKPDIQKIRALLE
jgi:acyl-coenzyme A synthetase/AMP-(fatty) acid ligase